MGEPSTGEFCPSSCHGFGLFFLFFLNSISLWSVVHAASTFCHLSFAPGAFCHADVPPLSAPISKETNSHFLWEFTYSFRFLDSGLKCASLVIIFQVLSTLTDFLSTCIQQTLTEDLSIFPFRSASFYFMVFEALNVVQRYLRALALHVELTLLL